jgi:hypothetical protein
MAALYFRGARSSRNYKPGSDQSYFPKRLNDNSRRRAPSRRTSEKLQSVFERPVLDSREEAEVRVERWTEDRSEPALTQETCWA